MSSGTSKASNASGNTNPELISSLIEATKLENELKSLAPGNDTRACRIRVKLCEIFSDALINDCTAALRKDVTGRLWFICFYKDIDDLRNSIYREKSRLRKYTAAVNAPTGSASTTSITPEALEKQKSRIADLDMRLKKVIEDGVALYKYLLDQLQGELLPPTGQTQMSPEFSQGSKVSQSNSFKVQKGVVPAIHKLYIHMGDLHRYASSFDEAESAYRKASVLSPSSGNPYNQMAVIAQRKETNPLPAVALYWYCRSLAANESFDTSKRNVEKLFQANEKWLSSSSASNVYKGNLKQTLVGLEKEKTKQIKTAASRTVLARFVTFQGYLLQNILSNVALKEDIDDVMMSLVNEMGEILDVNPFGGALLTKMVSIAAFTLWRSFHVKKSSEDEMDDDREEKKSVRINAYVFILCFGEQMCKYLEGDLKKSEEKMQSGKKATSIRLLGPLVLLCEFLSNARKMLFSEDMVGTSLEEIENGKYKKYMHSFWTGIAKIATLIAASPKLSNMVEVAVDDIDSSALPEDFEALSRGFAPFLFLRGNDDTVMSYESEGASSYITPEEAVDALGLNITHNQSQMSQQTRKSHTSERSTNEKSDTEMKMKLVRFMEFVLKHVNNGDLIKTGDGIKVAKPMDESPIDTDVSMADDQSPGVETDDMQVIVPGKVEDKEGDEGEKEEDVLVYKPSEQGKPALLTPSALLMGDTCEEKESGALLKVSDMVDKTQKSVDKEASTTIDTPLVGFLDPSMMVDQPFNSLPKNTYLSGNPTTVFGESKHDITPFASGNQQILSPMPLKTHGDKARTGTSLRPPPGFQPPEFHTAVLPPMIPAPQAAAPSHLARADHDGGFALPPHRASVDVSVVESQPAMNLPPSFPPNMGSDMPHTRNPFVALGHGTPVDGNRVSRLSPSNWLNTNLTNVEQPSFHQNASSTSYPSEYFGLNNEFDLDQHDRFGLRSLGIFSDERAQEPSDPSQHQTSDIRTRNPFVFD